VEGLLLARTLGGTAESTPPGWIDRNETDCPGKMARLLYAPLTRRTEAIGPPQRRTQATGGRSAALARRGQSRLSQHRQIPSIARKGDAFPGGEWGGGAGGGGGRRGGRRLTKAAPGAPAAPAVLRIGAAFAAYPDRPIRIVVANTPGGPSDIMARFMAAAMQEAMGASV